MKKKHSLREIFSRKQHSLGDFVVLGRRLAAYGSNAADILRGLKSPDDISSPLQGSSAPVIPKVTE